MTNPFVCEHCGELMQATQILKRYWSFDANGHLYDPNLGDDSEWNFYCRADCDGSNGGDRIEWDSDQYQKLLKVARNHECRHDLVNGEIYPYRMIDGMVERDLAYKDNPESEA